MTPAPGSAWLRPSPRMWTARLTLVALLVGPVVVTGVVVGLLTGVATLVSVVGGALVAGALLAAVLRRRFLAWGYAEREDDLLVRRGVMVRRLTVVPYGRMQYIEVTAGPLDRLFGLATVQLHTAAAATDATIPGLAAADAERLRDQLASVGEARAAGL